MNRLLHYAEFGCHEGRHPRPMVSRRTNDSRMDGSRENVIVVTHEASRTGAPVLAWNIIQHLAANYNVFTIMLDGGPLMRDFEALSAEVHGPFDLDRRHSADIEHGLRPLLDAREYKYAIINSSESRPVVEACARRLIPTVMLMHEFGSYVHPPDSLRRAFDMASEIVFPADIVARSSLELHPPLRERPVRILPQGMSALPASGKLAPISPPPAVDELIRARANGAFIVLGAGTVDYRKGVDLFIATAMAVRRSPQAGRARFVWVGHGYRPTEDMRYSVYLHEQVERSELKDHVTFISEVSDLEPIYALADAFLLTSRLDPMPNVSIDAAHRGIPVICFRDASGTADLLMTDSETATGVVDYLDSSAAAQVIVSLISDSNYRSRMSEATRNLASSVFDMAKYVAALDQLGTDASARAAERRDDVNLLSRTDEFDPDICLGPDPTFEPRKSTARRAVVQNAMQRQTAVRRIMPGFNQHIWRAQRAGSEVPHRDPLAEFILTGHPCGPWFTPVIRPPEDSKSLAAGGLRALLHVHLSDPTQAGNLEMRLKANRLDADLLITTDDDAKADRLRGMFAASARGAVHIVAVSPETQDGSEIDWLLSEVQRPEWAAHSIIGHLHDTGINSDWAVTEFHWTALLGSRQPMFDCILDAFARQPTLGLVFPSDPLLPPPDNPRDFPTAGMFWAHRATLQSLADTDLPRSPRTLPFACDAAGLTQAVTRVPGVFL
jgi:glycosyltransferase involved in cell wall biosynthesis